LEFWRKPIAVGAIGVLVTVVLVLTVVMVLLRTGGAKAVSNNAALIGALAGLGGVFTTQMVTSALEDQRRREARIIEANRTQEARDIEANRTQEARRIEAQRTQEARNIEEQRVQEAALKTYFEEMGELLRQGLRRSNTKEMGELLEQGLLKPQVKDKERIYEEQQLRSLANVQTTLILRELAPRRKWLLLQFLAQSRLIDRQAPIVDLSETDMREVILCEYLNIDKDTAGRYLGNNADPSKYLRKDDLSTVLRSTDADLDALLDILQDTRTHAVLDEINLHRANMIKAYLRSVSLRGADLGGAYLAEADLIDADLSNAYLGEAWLMEAILIAANLNMANLNRVSSYGAVLVKADLRGLTCTKHT
jgi:hypothetical protein